MESNNTTKTNRKKISLKAVLSLNKLPTGNRRFIAVTLFLVTVIGAQMAASGAIAPSASASRYLFAADLFQALAAGHTQKSVIFSPASVQSCLALAYMGAGSETAAQMKQALGFAADVDKHLIAQDYSEFAKSAFKASTEDGPQLRMANRIYVNDGLPLAPEFNTIAAKYFDSQAEAVHFADSATAVQTINAWVEQQTDNKIQQLLPADAVSGDTSAVLVNAIYFKAKWAQPFSALMTHKADFSISESDKIPVDMMLLDGEFRYGELPEMDATVLELPYKDSDLSMLILLPNAIDGLGVLEAKLAKRDLNELTAQMKLEDVTVLLPKFRIEYDVDLKQPLEQLGMTSMFSDAADFSELFATKTPQKVSEVRHKAFLDVSEGGSEAAATTAIKVVWKNAKPNQKQFNANHPFVFVILSPTDVYFAGHVAKF